MSFIEYHDLAAHRHHIIAIHNAFALASMDIGYCFLIILSQFLEMISGIGPWGRLTSALEKQGWAAEECQLLVSGQNVSSLLKPDEIHPSTRFVSNIDPYWYWIIPLMTHRRGWIPPEQVVALKDRVMHAAANPNVESISTDMAAMTKQSFAEAIAMLSAAEHEQKGLFFVILY